MTTLRHATDETQQMFIDTAYAMADSRKIGEKTAIDRLDGIISRAQTIHDDAAELIAFARRVKRVVKGEYAELVDDVVKGANEDKCETR